MNRHTWATLATVLTLIAPLASQAQPATEPAPAPQTEPAPAPAPAPMAPREKSSRVPHDKFAPDLRDEVLERFYSRNNPG